MSKLEEQLRKSREQERPDLQPPAGGWEAIQASLAATAAGVGTAAAATEAVAAGNAASAGAMGAAGTAGGAAGASAVVGAKTSILVTSLKALLGFCVVGGLATGAWVTLSSDEGADPEIVTATAIAAAENRQDASLSQDLSGNSTTDAAITDKATSPEKARLTETAATVGATAAQPGRGVSGQQGTTPVAGTAEPVKSGVPASTTNAATTPVAESGTTEERAQAPAPPANSANESAVADQSAENTTASQSVKNQSAGGTPPVIEAGELDEAQAAIPALGFTEVADPTPNQGGQVVSTLPGKPVDRVTDDSKIIFTGFESLSPFGNNPLAGEDGKFRKYKRPVVPEWRYHFATSAHISRRQFSLGGTPTLVRVPNGTGDETFTLPNGELVNADFSNFGFNGDFTDEDNVLIRGGVTRQTKWGGTFRGGLGLFHGVLESGVSPQSLGENEIGLTSRESSQAAFLEFGFHYTFLRRHRFQPYIGVDVMSFLFYNIDRKESFFDQQTGLEATRADFNVRQRTLPLSLDYGVTAGFQYRFSSRLSAGAFVWSNYGYEFYALAPVGLEVRYSFR